MLKKILIIYTVGLMALLAGLLSCGPFNCGPFPDSYKLKDMRAEPFYYEFTDVYGYCFEQLDYPADTISYNNWGLLLLAEIETYFSARQDNRGLANLLGPAWACSPPRPRPVEEVESLKIFCDKDFDAAHPAGSDLAELFAAIVPLKTYPQQYANCYDMREMQNLDDYFVENPMLFTDLQLALQAPPARSDSYTFTIEYRQQGVDVNYASMQVANVLLKP